MGNMVDGSAPGPCGGVDCSACTTVENTNTTTIVIMVKSFIQVFSAVQLFLEVFECVFIKVAQEQNYIVSFFIIACTQCLNEIC
jgi:hypothetical protein